jgi:hypothetical protein
LHASARVSEAYRSGGKAGLAMHAGTRRAACNDSVTQALPHLYSAMPLQHYK